MLKTLIKHKYRKHIPTPDQWYPTAADGTVRVSVFQYEQTPMVRVCVWGDDDFGLELDIRFMTDQAAYESYLYWTERVNRWSIVTQQMLKDLGFYPA